MALPRPGLKDANHPLTDYKVDMWVHCRKQPHKAAYSGVIVAIVDGAGPAYLVVKDPHGYLEYRSPFDVHIIQNVAKP